MGSSSDQALSKFLSFALRHRPDAVGLVLDTGGWAEVDDVLRAARDRGYDVDRERLARLVRESDKQRFAIDGDRIRANQGHSIDVDLGLAPLDPPGALYHGTARRVLNAILSGGLRRQSRHHVHLSADAATARAVGARHGHPVVLVVDAGRMATDGHVFFRSANGVWLTDHVPPQYLTTAERR